MTLRSCIRNPELPLIADASVLINLNASGRGADILDSLPNRIYAGSKVVEELETGRERGHDDIDAVLSWSESGRLAVVRLGSSAEQHFMDLVSGAAANTLDDGEAATIAYAYQVDGAALIDERKALRLCSERYPTMPVGSTVDVFLHDSVERFLGAQALSDALFNAIYRGRMRVARSHVRRVVSIIGEERAALCRSLSRVIAGPKVVDIIE